MKLNGGPGGRMAWVTATALLILHVGLAWAARQPDVVTGGDEPTYLLLARAIRSFSYSDQYVVGAPLHGRFLPGFPALLAAWSGIVGENFQALISLNIFLSAAVLLLVFATLARLWSPWLALLFLIPASVNPSLVSRAGSLMSEPAYAFFSITALVILARERSGGTRRVLAGGMVIFAVLVRPIGVSLLAAVGIFWFLRRHYRALVTLSLTTLATVGSWLITVSLVPSQFTGGSYVADFGVYSQTRGIGVFLHVLFLKTAEMLGSVLPDAIAFPLASGVVWDNSVWMAVLLVGGFVGLSLFFRRWCAAALYLLMYGLLLLAYPWITKRYLDPLLPLVLPLVILGVGAALSRWQPRVSRVAMVGLSLLLAVSGGVRSAEVIQQRRGCGDSIFEGARDCLSPQQVGYFDALKYVRSHTDPGAVVLAATGAALYYHTGRLTAPYRAVFAHGAKGFSEYVRDNGIDYVLLQRVSNKDYRLARILSRNCGQLRFVERFPVGVYLFAVSEVGSTVGKLEACDVLADYLKGTRELEEEHRR